FESAKPKHVIADLTHGEPKEELQPKVEYEEDLGDITLKRIPEDDSCDFYKYIQEETTTMSIFSDISLDNKAEGQPFGVPVLNVNDKNAQEFIVEKLEEELLVEENLAAKLVEYFGEFVPTLELSNYQFPTLDLLKDYGSGGITINQEELEENKNKIV